MAWSIPTYAGVAAHGRPSNLRVAMFELIRAIDERVTALGGTGGYGWWTAASSSASQVAPTFEQLEFLKCTGNKTGGTTANANKAYRNMVLITDRVIDMLEAGRFVTTSGGTTKYTQASIESAIGTTLEYPVSVTEARWWQSVQDALDLMIHAWSELVPDNYGAAIGSRSGLFSDQQDAWDSRTAIGTPLGGVPGTSNPAVGWASIHSGGGLFYSTIPDSFSSIDFMLSTFVAETILEGDVILAEYEYSGVFGTTTLTDFEVDLDGDSIVISSAGTSTAPATVSIGARINKSLSILTSEPSTIPFNGGLGGEGAVGVSITGLNVQHDLSTILTDQA